MTGAQDREFSRTDQPFNAQCRVLSSITETWRVIRVLDLSARGIRFEADHMIEDGVEVLIRMILPTSREALDIRGRAVWCRPAGSMFEVGVELLDFNPTQASQIDELVRFLQRRHTPGSS